MSGVPDPLGQLTDRVVETLDARLEAKGTQKKRHRFAFLRALSDWAAEILNRASSQSAGSVMVVYEDARREFAADRARMDVIEARLNALEEQREREAGGP